MLALRSLDRVGNGNIGFGHESKGIEQELVGKRQVLNGTGRDWIKSHSELLLVDIPQGDIFLPVLASDCSLASVTGRISILPHRLKINFNQLFDSASTCTVTHTSVSGYRADTNMSSKRRPRDSDPGATRTSLFNDAQGIGRGNEEDADADEASGVETGMERELRKMEQNLKKSMATDVSWLPFSPHGLALMSANIDPTRPACGRSRNNSSLRETLKLKSACLKIGSTNERSNISNSR